MPKCYIKDYPRPQFVRAEWENLNGEWDFAFDDADAGLRGGWQRDFPAGRTIRVPFAPECAASGIGDETFHPVVWYRRELPAAPPGKRTVLHFEGCDYEASVWVNGRLAGTHRGGCARFSFDVTELLEGGSDGDGNGSGGANGSGGDNGNGGNINCGGSSDNRSGGNVNGGCDGNGGNSVGENSSGGNDSGGNDSGGNTLVVRAADSDSLEQPRGKQRWRRENFGCWYVQTTGIWKTVWMEYRPQSCIEKVKMTPALADGSLRVEWDVSPGCPFFGDGLELAAEISFEGAPIRKAACSVDQARGSLLADVRSDSAMTWGLRPWTPEDPALYDIEFSLLHRGRPIDRVSSYFGMRDIEIAGGRILLNGNPLYQRLVLDQGYWPDSHMTPPGEAALADDIAKIKRLGFNGARKHQKIEDERFFYLCDALGLLAWCEMPSAYAFGDGMARAFADEWLSVVEQHYNHPSVITWTPFNESWGIPNVRSSREQQHFTQAVYHLTKAIDPMRPVITNDGWEHTVSDILTLHDYEESGAAFLRRYSGKDGEAACSGKDSAEGGGKCGEAAGGGMGSKGSEGGEAADSGRGGAVAGGGLPDALPGGRSNGFSGGLRGDVSDGFLSRFLNGFPSGQRAAFAEGFAYAGQPVIVSEFGGIAYASGTGGDAWGYGSGAESEEALLRRMDGITSAIGSLPYVCGYCYTQLTDVQQEVNGLLDAGREFKASCEAVREINERQGAGAR
jgi:hypothetical protein